MEETADVTPGFLFTKTKREADSTAALFSLVSIIPLLIFSSFSVRQVVERETSVQRITSEAESGQLT